MTQLRFVAKRQRHLWGLFPICSPYDALPASFSLTLCLDLIWKCETLTRKREDTPNSRRQVNLLTRSKSECMERVAKTTSKIFLNAWLVLFLMRAYECTFSSHTYLFILMSHCLLHNWAVVMNCCTSLRTSSQQHNRAILHPLHFGGVRSQKDAQKASLSPFGAISRGLIFLRDIFYDGVLFGSFPT